MFVCLELSRIYFSNFLDKTTIIGHEDDNLIPLIYDFWAMGMMSPILQKLLKKMNAAYLCFNNKCKKRSAQIRKLHKKEGATDFLQIEFKGNASENHKIQFSEVLPKL